MKSFVLLLACIACTSWLQASTPDMQSVSITNGQPASTPAFELRRVGNVIAAFKYNSFGNVSEYFLVQGIDWDINQTTINTADYTEGNDIRWVGSNGKTYVFSITERNSSVSGNTLKYSVSGIVHMTFLAAQGVPIGSGSDIAFRQWNDLDAGKCDGDCLGGGCGSSSCSRTVWELECSVSCGDGLFACCGDLTSKGCHCRSNTCCGNE